MTGFHSEFAVAWRRLLGNKVTSAAAVLSLTVCCGACIAAFRLIDGLLLRPLPIAAPERLMTLVHRGLDPARDAGSLDTWQYPLFREMRPAATGLGRLIAVSDSERVEIELQNGQEFERSQVQYVSGEMFEAFGLRPALGRLLTRNDDQQAGLHPVAVVSHDFWSQRLARDPHAAGRTFRLTNNLTGTRTYQIIGVAADGFLGTEPGRRIDIFLPASMHWSMPYPNWSTFRILAHLHANASESVLGERLGVVVRAFDQSTGARSGRAVELRPTSTGVSGVQKQYRTPLAILAALGLVLLLIGCANIANLMTAQAMARSHDTGVRVSLGATRWQLGRLALIEAAIIGVGGSIGGWCLAEAAIPVVLAKTGSPGSPVGLPLAVDWRVLAFAAALTLAVPLLCALPAALQASSMRPVDAIKGVSGRRSHARWMSVATAMQAALCFMTLHAAAMFVFSFHRLSNQTTGFTSERLVVFDIATPVNQPSTMWDQVADRLRGMPGIEAVAYADWPLLDGRSFKSNPISINGQPPSAAAVSFMNVSPSWLETMKIPLIAGRDFDRADLSPGAAIVNETFAAQFFPGESPLRKSFEGTSGWMQGQKFQILGLVRDALYRDVRLVPPPVAYTPFRRTSARGTMQGGALLVRTAEPGALNLVAALRAEIPRIRPEFRVSNVQTQQAVIESQAIRERVLAMLAQFFGLAALVLACVGLYGVLDHSVLLRRREIGVRMALGEPPGSLAVRVTARTLSMVVLGAAAGLVLSIIAARYIESLLYQVRPSEPPVIGVAAFILLGTATLAALPAVARALDIDPIDLLKTDSIR